MNISELTNGLSQNTRPMQYNYPSAKDFINYAVGQAYTSANSVYKTILPYADDAILFSLAAVIIAYATRKLTTRKKD